MGVELVRVGIIGDVHTECHSLEVVLDHLAQQGVDRLLCTGDLADGPLGPEGLERCCELLQERSVLTICGNHDRWLQEGQMRGLQDAVERDEIDPESLAYLEGLAATLELKTPLGSVQLCHGLGADDMALVQPHDHASALQHNGALQTVLSEDRFRVLINGHSHRRMVRPIAGLTILNAGTLLRTAQPCCALADFGSGQIRFYNVDPDGGITEAESYSF